MSTPPTVVGRRDSRKSPLTGLSIRSVSSMKFGMRSRSLRSSAWMSGRSPSTLRAELSTSLQMIADELGFTKAAIYYHFRTREQLLNAVVEPIFVQLRDIITTAESQRSVHARAEHMLSGYAALAVQNRAVVSVLAGDPSVATMLRSQHEWGDLINRQLALLADVDPVRPDWSRRPSCWAGSPARWDRHGSTSTRTLYSETWWRPDDALLGYAARATPERKSNEDSCRHRRRFGYRPGDRQALGRRRLPRRHHRPEPRRQRFRVCGRCDGPGAGGCRAGQGPRKTRPGKRFGQRRGRRRVQALHRYLVRRLAAGDQRESATASFTASRPCCRT